MNWGQDLDWLVRVVMPAYWTAMSVCRSKIEADANMKICAYACSDEQMVASPRSIPT